MGKWVKRLLCKHKDLDLDLYHLCKKLGVCLQSQCWGWSDKGGSLALIGRPAYSIPELQCQWETLSQPTKQTHKNNVKSNRGSHPVSLLGFHLCTLGGECFLAHTRMCTHRKFALFLVPRTGCFEQKSTVFFIFAGWVSKSKVLAKLVP